MYSPCGQKMPTSSISRFGVLVDSQLFFRSFLQLYIGSGQQKEGAFASIIAALISWLYFFHLSGYGGELVIGPGIIPAAICFAVAAIAMVLVSLLTKPPTEETLQKFFPSAKKL